MAKRSAAVPIMQQEADAGNTVDETELAPENPEAPVVVEGAPEGGAAPAADAAAKPAVAKAPIPHERFEEVNGRMKKAEQEATELRDRWARMDERRKQAQEIEERARATADAAKLQAQRPDPDVDPQAARIWDLEQRLGQVTQVLPQLQQNFQQTTQQYAADREQQQLNQWEANDVARVTAMNPDYAAARDYLQQKRVGHYMSMGHDQASAQQLFNLERAAYVRQCATNGKSIAELAYSFAKELGYPGPQAQQAAPNGNGAAHANGAPNGAQRITQLQNGQKVQGLGGKVPSAESDSTSNIKMMNAGQFAEWLETMNEEQFIAKMNTDPKLREAVNQKYQELG